MRSDDSRRQFLPLTGRRKAAEVNERNAIYDGMADLYHASKTMERFFVDLLVGDKLGIVQKIPQEPAQLPHRLLRAVEPTDNRLSQIILGLENSESKDIERFLGVPSIVSRIDSNQE